ncbi:bifunctional DNA-formamidopyrimidine glycosylase/DNA-(apurinic or apyrimidinic site) lyase [soil metagenome]
MPELPEVQTVVDTLRPRLLGKTVRAVHLSRQDIVTPANVDLPSVLVGRSIQSIDRRAKRIVFIIDEGNRFYIHLGMSGRLTSAKPADAVAPHTHLTIDFATGEQLRFVDPRRFGGIWWLGQSADDATLGPEPLTLSTDDLAARLKKTRRAIKSALLDQSLIAGLGNIYVDESLFVAGIHPLKTASRLSREQVERLNRAIKQVRKRASQAGGSTLKDYVDGDGQRGRYQKRHNVYDRATQPCVTCKSPIKRIVLGGRSTHFCMKCQTR